MTGGTAGPQVNVGVFLYPPNGVVTIDEQIAQAKAADRQGFHSVWLGDHLMDFEARRRDGDEGAQDRRHLHPDREANPERPPDSFTLMTAIGAVTERVHLAWAVLNPSFRNPALFAKMLATLDQISHGRVICSLGAGWFQAEYDAYDIPFIEDHGERLVQAREVAELLKALWTNPAPERVNYEGKYVRVRDLAFNPAPYQKPHPPIWIGGDSDATLANVKAVADGWILSMADLDRVEEAKAAPDWPSRPLAIARTALIAVGETPERAEAEAGEFYEAIRNEAIGIRYSSYDEFRASAIVGTPTECRDQLAERAERGLTTILTMFRDMAHQELVADLLLPLLSQGPVAAVTR